MGGGRNLRHYSKAEWQLYINKEYDDLSRQEMQNHLLSCDACMTLYLDLIDEAPIENDTVLDGFTDRVMEQIHMENVKSEGQKLKQKRINMFIYYVSAASITLFLMNAGVFESIYQSFASEKKYLSETSQKKSLFTNGWTSRLTEDTSKFINGFLNKKLTFNSEPNKTEGSF